MSTAGLTLQEVEPTLVEFGLRHAVIEKLEIFGSLATGRATEESDLDVLVTFGTKTPGGLDYFSFFIELQEELVRLFGRRVDLVDRRSLKNDLFGYNVNRRARVVYERS